MRRSRTDRSATPHRAWTRPWRSFKAWLVLLSVVVVAALGWLAWEGHLFSRVYYYTEGDAAHEVGGAPEVRSVLWTPPREIPAAGGPGPEAAPPGAPGSRPPPPRPDAWSAKSAILLAVKTAAGDHDLFVRELTASGWTAPAPLDGGFAGEGAASRREGLINTPFDELTPALAPAGDAIYFASNRPGGLGGFDLWRSRRGPDGWEKPANLGGRLNSPYDDLGPAPHPAGQLLVFATTRPRSFILSPPAEWADLNLENWKRGPEELAAAVLVEEDGEPRWSAPLALDPLSSPHDEREPSFTPAGDFLYFASNRAGGLGGADLYRARVVPDAGGEGLGVRFAAPENLGRPLNSAHEDRAPKLFLEGFALAYEVSEAGRPGELLLESRTREVASEVQFASSSLRALSANLARVVLLAAGGALLALLGLVAYRYRVWRLSLLTRCAVASLLVHGVLLYGFAFWIVSEDIVALAAREADVSEVTVEKMLQAKITIEASRIDVAVPDLAAPRAAPQAPTELEPSRFAIDRFLGSADPAPGAVIETATSGAVADLASASSPDLARADEAARGDFLAAPSVAQLAAAPAAAGSLPVPDVTSGPAARPGDVPLPAAGESAKTEIALPAEAPARAFEAAAALGSPGETVLLPAVTQVQAPVEEVAALPPVARPSPRTAPSVAPLPVPEQAPAAAAEHAELAGTSAPRAAPGRELAGGAEPASAPRVRTTEPTGAESHWRSVPVGIAARLGNSEGSLEAPEAPFLPDAPPAPVPGSPVRLPENLPRAEVAGGAERGLADGIAPRASEKLAVARAPDAGQAAAGMASPAWVPEARPMVAPSDSLSPVTAAADVLLGAEPSPGVAAPLLAPEAHPPRPAAVSLPERTAPPKSQAGGAEVADVIAGGPQGKAEKAAFRLPAAARSPEAVPAGDGPAGDPARVAALAGPVAEPDAASMLKPRGADPEGPAPPLPEPGSSALVASAEKLPEAPPELKGRTDLKTVRSARVRKALVERMGGTGGSEGAVKLALEWLARHQASDGRWDVDGFDAVCRGCRSPGFQTHCDAAVTGLAVLAFLGQGHLPGDPDGPYQRNVAAAIDWLARGQGPDGSLAQNDQRYTMYTHGIATLALSEAYTLTRDARLLEPVRKAVRLIVASQNQQTGGWRYLPQPPIRGDTSITGWQVLALTSARGAGLEVAEAVFERARHWLDAEVGGGRHGGIYGYTRKDDPTLAMVAEGMYARQLLGAKRTDRSIEESARYIQTESRRGFLDNLYLLYYGNMALYHYQGWIWERWNIEVREFLVKSQHKTGPLAGSWDPTGVWSEAGGRVLSTCLAALTLEVYYRYLPLYWKADQAEE